jgi:alpha-L-fucosidase
MTIRSAMVATRAGRAALVLALAAVLAACSDAPSPDAEPTLCGDASSGGDAAGASADATSAPRPLPAWYDDAKLGIMVHWGVWAVPGWAETTLDPERVADPNDPEYLLAPGGIENFVKHNPYTEWYQNSLAIDGTATQAFHRDTYGADFPYTGFQPLFEQRSAHWRPDDWARLFAAARARYVVFVSKHHDGYALWPTSVVNPERPGWSSPRDLVGELADAARARCMRVGVYYSGGIDWSFAPPPIVTALDFLDPAPPGAAYAHYVDAQYRELIARYRPSILWNDITAPAGLDLASLFTDYYAAVPDGVVDDRWGLAAGTPPPDFRTVEYDVKSEISPDKWEAVRGIGRTFGYNANESVADYGTPEKYLDLLIDVVSKNGNLLLNVGPMADGTIPAPQVEILRALGSWLDRYGAAIFATRPWTRYAGSTDQSIDVRFTRSQDGRTVYAILLGTPDGGWLKLRDFPENPLGAHLVGDSTPLAVQHDADGLLLLLPSDLPMLPAHAIALSFG